MFAARFLTKLAPCQMARSSRIPVRMMSSQTLSMPDSDSTSPDSKKYPDKIVSIVDHISQLTLLEVADLNELLKAKLKITDAPVMMAGSFAGAPAAAAPEEEEEAAHPVAVQVTDTMDSLSEFREYIIRATSL